MSQQCFGRTSWRSSRVRCERRTTDPSGYCWQHRHQNPFKKAN